MAAHWCKSQRHTLMHWLRLRSAMRDPSEHLVPQRAAPGKGLPFTLALRSLEMPVGRAPAAGGPSADWALAGC